MDIRNLMLRASSGLIYVGLIVGCILWGVEPFAWLAAVFAVLGVIEFIKISQRLSVKYIPALILDIAGAVCLVFSWLSFPLLIWIIVLICRMILELYMKSDNPLSGLSHSMMAQLYIGLPLCLMTIIGISGSLNIVLAIFLMIWINDTGAFIVGSIIGRHRLFERISPKKSWEGFIGGMTFNIAASVLFFIYGNGFFGMEGWQLYQAVSLSLVVTVFGTWGDLVESMIKRSLHIKDSGNIIPGHGGILDRIDSLLLVMPAAFIFLILMKLI